MKSRQIQLIFFLGLLIIGCARTPFNETLELPLNQLDPQQALINYKKKIPEEINLLNSVVFQYNRHKILGIGQVAANLKKKTFLVVCLNPMGLKLFQLSGDEHSTKQQFAMKMLTEKGDFSKQVGNDIRNIYFNLAPSAYPQIKTSKYEIVFSEPASGGITEYVLAGEGPYLVKKRYYQDGRLIWEVSYYEYQTQDDKIYPRGIVLDNHKYDYRLIVRLKEIG